MVKNVPIKSFSIQKKSQHQLELAEDRICVESPLEMRIPVLNSDGQIIYKSLAVTMRTPGSDEELVTGFLYAEGFIKSIDEVLSIEYATDRGEAGERNSININLKKPVAIKALIPERRIASYSSCGLCGKTTIQNLELQNPPVLDESQKLFNSSMLTELCEQMRAKQLIFKETGSAHASALFDHKGNLIHLEEDIGRHNALDKLTGFCLKNYPNKMKNSLIIVSGRASFEMVQKTIMAGVPLLLAIGAPSSLAIETAKRFNLTLIGHFRENEFNIYNAPWRLNHDKDF